MHLKGADGGGGRGDSSSDDDSEIDEQEDHDLHEGDYKYNLSSMSHVTDASCPP